MLPSVLAATSAGLLLGASAVGRTAFAVALGVLQLALVVGWFRAAPVSGRSQAPGAIAAAIAAGAADVAVLRTHPPTDVRALAGVLAALVGVAFAVQLVRRDGRPQLAAGLAATVSAGTLAVMGAIWLGVRAGHAGPGVVAAGLLATGVAVLAVQPRLPAWGAVPMGLAAAALAGWLVATRDAAVSVPTGLAVAAAAAIAAVCGRYAAALAADAPRSAVAATVTLPVLVVAPVVLVVARVLID